MEKKRCVKMDAIMKNMLIYALRDVYREEKEKGISNWETGELILRLAAHEEKKLYMTEEEYRKIVEALNKLRDSYLSAGRYADGIDTVLLKILQSKYKRCALRG